MLIKDLTIQTLYCGEILTGRSALGYYNIGCSIDPRVIMIVSNISKEIYFEPLYIIPKEKNFEYNIIENNYKIASLNQAIYHTILYDYDDSCVFELSESLSDIQISDFIKWLKIRNLYYNIEDKLYYYEFINESIRDKFDLFMEHLDIEFKHLVDVIICINSDYPEGITKKQMLNLIDESKLIHPNLDILLHLASKFKPQELNGMKMEEYAIAFDTLVKGLIDDNTFEDDIFKNNKWYEIN